MPQNLEFYPPVSAEKRSELIALVDELIGLCPKLKHQYGRDLAMDDEDLLVSKVAKFDLGEEVGTVTVARSEAIARPPFEWLAEITCDINDVGYLKHYLVRESDVVLAHRKVLTEIDDQEAERIIGDLKQTIDWCKLS
jgi:hypothetical protein